MFYTYSRLRVSVNHLVAEGQFTIEHTSGARAARPGALSRCGPHGWGVLVLLEAIVIRPTCSLSTHTAVSIREGRSQESGRRLETWPRASTGSLSAVNSGNSRGAADSEHALKCA
jgi:hypothetical protein